MSEKRKITRATGVMGIATTLSRFAGLARDMVVASLFGAGFGTDAFFMAFTIPNLLRRFFAEGSLTAAFVPTFSDVYHHKGRAEANRVANICLTLLVLIMIGVVIAGMVASPWVVRVIGFGFGGIEGKLALTDTLNRVMFPYIFFVSILALLAGVLNVTGHYFIPSVSTLLLNLAMVVSAVSLSHYFSIPIMSLAVGVLIGGLLQVMVQFPVLRRQGFYLRPDFHFRDPVVFRIGLLMLPGVVGMAIYQINVVVSRLLASFLAEGSVSYLYYGQRLFEFPQGIFIVSLGQAILPSLSRQVAASDMDGARDSLRYGLSLTALVTIPAAAGLVVCAVPIYSLFFMSGAFDYGAVRMTAAALAAFAPGLLFVGVSRMLVATFYALKDTRTPVWVSFWTLLTNAVLGLALMRPLGHTGLALALTLASAFNAAALLWALRRRVGGLGLVPLVGLMARVSVASAAMALCVHHLLSGGPWERVGEFWTKAGILFPAIGGGVVLYALICWMLRVREIETLFSLVHRKVLRR